MIAINSMAQPAGKFLRYQARCRIYLANSPILCFGDTLCTIVRIVQEMAYKNCRYYEACRRAVVSKVETSTQGVVGEAGNYTWPRLLYFLIGTLPSVIKLASFSGVPWTKTWGLMFISSFAINEAVIFSARASTHTHHEDIAPVPFTSSIMSVEIQDETRSQVITDASHSFYCH
jgi:hypothetical protein